MGGPFVESGQAWGEEKPDRAACNLRPAGGEGARRLLQLQPDASRFEPGRSAVALERSPQLAGNHRGSAEIYRSLCDRISTRGVRHSFYVRAPHLFA